MGAYGNTEEASKVDSTKLATLGATILLLEVLSLDPRWRLSYEASDVWHNPSNGGAPYWWQNLVPGNYTFIFKPVSGWTSPLPYYTPIGEGSQIPVLGQYLQQ